jgi:hypothetical protein
VNILEYKRKLLGHCYMGGGGSNSGGGGNGGSANDGNAGESEARAYVAAQADAARQPIKETSAAESAPAPAVPAAPAAPSESEKTAADNVARERATAAAAKAESERAAAAQQAAAASLMGGAGENQNANPFSATVASDKQLADRAQLAKDHDLQQQANEKLASYYGKDANKYPTPADQDPDAIAAVYKELMGATEDKKLMLPGGKDKEAREVTSTVPENKFYSVFGRAPTYAEAKALQKIGLGNITGVNPKNDYGTNLPVANASGETWAGLVTNEPGQTADSIVATTDFVNFMEPLARAAALFVPGMSLALTLNDMRTGKITAGDVASSFVLSMIARNFGIPVGVVTNAINGNPGGMISSALVGQINTAVSKEFNTNPILTGIFGKESGVYGEVAKPFNGLNQNWGTTKAISNAFNEGLRSVGITAGTGAPNSATGQQVNTSTDSNDTLSNYLSNTGGGGSSAAPAPAAPAAPAPAKAAPATSGNTSKSSSSLDALGAAAFGLTGALGSSLGSSDATDSSASNTASLSSVAPFSMASNIQTKVIPTQPKFQSALEKFQQLQQSENPDAVQYALSDQTPQGDSMAPYSYGVDRPIGDILNPQDVAMQDSGYGYSPDGVPDYMKTGIQAASGGAMTGTRYGKYARGGLSTPLMAAGGKMRVDFRHGDAVTGAGDGQSDDIPAMLADGEFVFPADVVAAIGNGSTKAGSDKLYDMMHGIRAHVRSAKPKDLPPEIKSPLDFLKNTKRQGAKHG